MGLTSSNPSIAISVGRLTDVMVSPTLTSLASFTPVNRPTDIAIEGFEEVKPMVFAGIYPVDTEEYEELRASMLTTNSGILDEETIWLWNQATASYDTKVTAEAYKLAPGQAFFIKSDGESGTLALNKSFQTHHTSDTFQRPDQRPEIYLTLSI